MTKDYLVLKFGTIKYVSTEDKRIISLYEKYLSLGHCGSVLPQIDNLEQKDIIYQIIDLIDGYIYNGYTDHIYRSKEDAKEYVSTFDKSNY